jgi:hypothetical protein
MPKPRSEVELYEQIRQAHIRDGLSIRELSRRFLVHRRDVRADVPPEVAPPYFHPYNPAILGGFSGQFGRITAGQRPARTV